MPADSIKRILQNENWSSRRKEHKIHQFLSRRKANVAYVIMTLTRFHTPYINLSIHQPFSCTYVWNVSISFKILMIIIIYCMNYDVQLDMNVKILLPKLILKFLFLPRYDTHISCYSPSTFAIICPQRHVKRRKLFQIWCPLYSKLTEEW